MKIIIASSKTMREKKAEKCNLPIFIDQAKDIVDGLKRLEDQQLAKILQLDLPKAKQWVNYYQNLDLTKDLGYAIECYQGVVFKQICDVITQENQQYISDHVCIISALYGLLKPYDGIAAYRLDMADKFEIRKQNLYQFWSNLIYLQLEGQLIINLASDEYSSCIRRYLKENEAFVDIDFIEIINQQERRISTNLKKARGQMLRYLIENKVDDLEELKKFDYLGYRFDENKSTTNKLVFVKSNLRFDN